MRTLIDGDPFAYQAAFSKTSVTEDDALELVDDLLYQALNDVDPFWEDDDYTLFLTGSGNFRFEIAVSYPYKGTRQSAKPEFLPILRHHMIENWSAVVSEGEEADDLIGIASTELYPSCVVVSIDKDMLQLPGTHYNPVKRTWTEVDEFGGLRFFYQQILMGDNADNIIGLSGVGPKKSERMLENLTTEEELWDAVVQAYDGDIDRIIENGRLLWLRRFPGQLWTPPVVSEEAGDAKE